MSQVMSSQLNRRQLKRQLQNMGDYEFEHFVADLWKAQGWQTEVEQQSSDAGVDVRAVKRSPYPQKQLIQAKRYSASTKVGGPDIQQYASLKQQEQGVDAAVIVTTSSFTSSAERRARDLNVKLVDADDLLDMISELGASHVLENHIDASTGTRAKSHTQQRSTAGTSGKTVSKDPITVIDIPLFDIEYDASGTPANADPSKQLQFYAIGVGVLCWLPLFLLFLQSGNTVGPIASILLAFAGSVITPIAIALDCHSVGVVSRGDDIWQTAVLGSMIPMLGVFGVGLYLLHRRGIRLASESKS